MHSMWLTINNICKCMALSGHLGPCTNFVKVHQSILWMIICSIHEIYQYFIPHEWVLFCTLCLVCHHRIKMTIKIVWWTQFVMCNHRTSFYAKWHQSYQECYRNNTLKKKGSWNGSLGAPFWKMAPFCKEGAIFSIIIMFRKKWCLGKQLPFRKWHQNGAPKGPVLRTAKRPFWCHLFFWVYTCFPQGLFSQCILLFHIAQQTELSEYGLPVILQNIVSILLPVV